MRLAVLGILLAVVVSGCTNTTDGSTGSTGGSVVIKSFTADETDVQGNEKVELTTGIVNSGDSRATSVTLQLLDIDLRCSTAPTNPADTSCESTSTQWGLVKGEQRHQINDLRIASGGETPVPAQYSWRVQAPKVPTNLKQPYNAKARVSFTYSTTALKQIKLVTLDEYQRLKARGETLPVTTTRPSNGPLGIDVKVNEPVKIEGGSTSFVLVIEINNLANGNAFLAGTDPNVAGNRDQAKLNITLPSGLSMADTGECITITQAGGLTIDLAKGKTFKLACEVSAAAPTVSTDKTVVVNLGYGYFVDASLSTPITVTGKLSYAVVSGGQTTTTQQGQTTTTQSGGGADNEAPAAVASASFSVSTPAKDPNTPGKFLITGQFFQPSDNKGVTAFEIIVDKIQPTSDCGNCANLARITPPAAKTAGELITFGPVSLDQQATYYITVRAKDAAGNTGPVVTKSVQTGQY